MGNAHYNILRLSVKSIQVKMNESTYSIENVSVSIGSKV